MFQAQTSDQQPNKTTASLCSQGELFVPWVKGADGGSPGSQQGGVHPADSKLGQAGNLLTPHRPPGHRTPGPTGTAEQCK